MSSVSYKEFEPLQDRILVRQHAKVEKKNGLFIPESMQKREPGGYIVAKGESVEKLDIGDKILFGGHAGFPVIVDEEEMICMREIDAYAKTGKVEKID